MENDNPKAKIMQLEISCFIDKFSVLSVNNKIVKDSKETLYWKQIFTTLFDTTTICIIEDFFKYTNCTFFVKASDFMHDEWNKYLGDGCCCTCSACEEGFLERAPQERDFSERTR